MHIKNLKNMNKTELTIGRIGFRPTKTESAKMLYICKIYSMNRCDLVRLLLYGHWTLDELYTFLQKITPKNIYCPISYLGQVYDPDKSIDSILKEGEKLFLEKYFGVDMAAKMMSNQ